MAADKPLTLEQGQLTLGIKQLGSNRSGRHPAGWGLAFSLLAGVLCIGAFGCGASATGYCEDFCDCVGCSDAALEECIDSIEDIEKKAEEEGCEDEFDDNLGCLQDEFRCSGGQVDQDGCGSEASRLANCLN